MPTYDYICENCGHEFERFQSITARPLSRCPECGRNELKRLIGAGAGVIFKGTGFYETDYRSEDYKKSKEKEKSTADKSAAESKTKKDKSKDKKSSAQTKSGKKDRKKTA